MHGWLKEKKHLKAVKVVTNVTPFERYIEAIFAEGNVEFKYHTSLKRTYPCPFNQSHHGRPQECGWKCNRKNRLGGNYVPYLEENVL